MLWRFKKFKHMSCFVLSRHYFFNGIFLCTNKSGAEIADYIQDFKRPHSNGYSLLFNTSHGILIREKWDFPPNPFIPAWSLSKSLLCLLLHPGLKPFLFTWKQWWCHCYINRGLLCSVFQPGLWVNGMACLVIQTCFWKKSGMSPNTTWLVLKRKEYTSNQSSITK